MADQQDDSRRAIRTKNQDRDYHSDENEEPRRSRMVGECQQAVDGEPREAAGCRKHPLVRSKTFDNSLLIQIPTDANGKIERKKSHYSQLSKSNCQYHKIFKEISKEEQLRQSYTCALQKDILYQGRMFVSDHWICFHSKVFGKDTKIAIPVTSITNIKKTKTAILVPNALVISTANDRYVFVSFLSRDNTYKFLMSVSLHLEEKSPCNSPVPSSAGSGLRSQRSPCSPRSPRFPLNFPADFSDLDAAVRQRRHELEESSSSDSQTPDDDKMAGFRVPPFLDALKRAENPAHPERQDLQHRVKSQPQKQQNQNNKLRDGGSERIVDKRSRTPVSLNTLLYVYLFLVCVLVLSSCYLAFKIISLEHRLTSLSSVSGFPAHQDGLQRENSAMTADLFSELLTVNLLKLEKVQKNLQKLLDEAA